jgi:hypothetical protein
MDFDLAFDEIASAMASAATERRIAAAEIAAERHGLMKLDDGKPSQISVWERSDQGKTLRFRWRWYDQSQAFSIRPDMNILTLELRMGDQILRQAEQRYED